MSDDVLAEALRPVGLGDRGEALWAALTREKVDPASAVLIAEVARLADMLELLDGIIRGDSEAWASVEIPETGQTSKLVISGAVSERRQTVTVIRHALNTLTTMRAGTAPAGNANSDQDDPDVDDTTSTAQAPTVDEIAEKRERRRAAASDL